MVASSHTGNIKEKMFSFKFFKFFLCKFCICAILAFLSLGNERMRLILSNLCHTGYSGCKVLLWKLPLQLPDLSTCTREYS